MTYKFQTRFTLNVAFRIALILASALVFAYFWQESDLWAVKSLLFLTFILCAIELNVFVSQTNRQLARFINEFKFGEGGQQTAFENNGASFEELAGVMNHSIKKVQEKHEQNNTQLIALRAQLDVIPVPVLEIHEDGHLRYVNSASRKLFDGVLPSNIEGLKRFGNTFFDDISSLHAGSKKVSHFTRDDIEQKVLLHCSELSTQAGTSRLISLQNIQQQLDDVETSAWQQLVTILTHEIMNSITPIASLSNSACELANEFSEDTKEILQALPNAKDDLASLTDSITRIAHRSKNLLGFVQSYRQVAQLPQPQTSKVTIKSLFDNALALQTAQCNEKGIQLTYTCKPDNLSIELDKQLIEQTLINLVLNAMDAVAEASHPQIDVIGFVHESGRGAISVSDNGCGIPEGLRKKIFLPFYTTKKQGSGVGLALAQQIMLAHGGAIKLITSDKMTKFILIF